MTVREVKNDEVTSADTSPFGKLASGKPRKPEAGTKAAAKPPQMAELARILGSELVLSIFPQGLMEAVDYGYTFWLEHPDSYIDVAYDTVQERNDVEVVMRAYAECAPKGPYTIRTVQTDVPEVLSWRAQNRRGAKAE
jgi:hypothetical protein